MTTKEALKEIKRLFTHWSGYGWEDSEITKMNIELVVKDDGDVSIGIETHTDDNHVHTFSTCTPSSIIDKR